MRYDVSVGHLCLAQQQVLAACLTVAPHQSLVKQLELIKVIRGQQSPLDDKWQEK